MSSPDHQPTVPTPVIDPDSSALSELATRAATLEPSVRATCATHLKAIGGHLQEAAGLWQTYIDEPTPSDDRFTAVMWIGAGRARALHSLHLKIREIARQLNEDSGVGFRDTMGIAKEIDIVNAYDELAQNETGTERAREALATIDQRRARVDDVVAAISS